ncbi:MAG: diphosphate--fructose-6-phosphate 1-phosphotransferase [Bryobacteraceae bacterium]
MSRRLRGAAVVAHGGGPTQVLNASLAGVIRTCRRYPEIERLWGARFGLSGLLQDDFVDLFAQEDSVISALADAPGSAIGSSRRKLTASDYVDVVRVLRRHEVRYFFYAGGNGSMDTALRVERTALDQGYELRVIGIPKTVDNDIALTDHTPGYASAARFSAFAARDIGADNRALPSPITVLEVIGRNVGWIAAATALARSHADDAPHLIYFPERPVSEDRIIADVDSVYRRLGRVVIAVCEGQMNEKGEPFGADLSKPGSARDRLASNLGHTLARIISENLGVRARNEKPGLLSRSSSQFASPADRQEAWMCGEAAVQAAAEGLSGKMVTLQREDCDSYKVYTSVVDLGSVAGIERGFPVEWIAESGNDVRAEFLEYARPLIGEVPAIPLLRSR